MQKNKETDHKDSSPNRKIPVKNQGTQSTRRSRKHSSSPKASKSNTTSTKPKPKRQKATPKMIPKLKIPSILSPNKANPSSSRLHQSSRRKNSSRRHSKTKSSAPIEKVVNSSSEKQMSKDSKKVQVLQTSLLLKPKQGPSDEEISTWSTLPLPQSPSAILEMFPRSLSKYEQSEILTYSEIFCIGVKARKSRTRADNKLNYGLDDERGDYRVEYHDHIAYRYEILKTLGSGSFGQVLLVRDHKTSENFALKVIRNKTRFHQQALVEVEVLTLVTEKDCNDQYSTVHMLSHFTFRKHMCIVFELLSLNLYELLKTNEFNGLSCNLIRRFANQIATTLKLLSRYSIIHCDLKPENILLRQANRSSIKVIDFGSSCFKDKRIYTYIQSRFYRAPEVILGIPYNNAIDIWSLGCILVELQTGYPLFPGENEAEQIACMMEVLGLPPKSLLKQATRTEKFFDNELSPKLFMNSRGKVRKINSKSLENIMKNSELGLIDVVRRCLDWDPATRITPEELLGHVWMKETRMSTTKNFSRRDGSQPHQGNGLGHCHKLSFEDGPCTIRNSFLAGSCKATKAPSFIFNVN